MTSVLVGFGSWLDIFIFDEPATINPVTGGLIKRVRGRSVITAGYFHPHTVMLPREIFDRGGEKSTHTESTVRRRDTETRNSPEKTVRVEKRNAMERCRANELSTGLNNKNARIW